MESDQELADRAAGGDRLAYRDLVRRYEAVVYGFCLHLTRDPDEAHRLAREAFVEGFFRSSPGAAPYGWISAILRIVTDLYREGRRVKSSSIVATGTEGAEERKEASKLELPTILAISEEVHALAEQDRVAITLRHSNRMTSEEIAGATGEAAPAVSTRLSRGFKSLRDGLVQRMREGGLSVGV